MLLGGLPNKNSTQIVCFEAHPFEGVPSWGLARKCCSAEPASLPRKQALQWWLQWYWQLIEHFTACMLWLAVNAGGTPLQRRV
jgi:hypothetical protein